MGYFFSPQDWRSGWNTGPGYVYYGNPVDRRAHGDVPFLEWYLKQFAAAERKGGRRLLDFLDIHGYIAPDDVQFKPAGDTANQVLRLESVRAFWDTTYFETAVNDTPYLVPRMRDWVARNYPHTMTAITVQPRCARSHQRRARPGRPARRLRPRGSRHGRHLGAAEPEHQASTPTRFTATTTMRGTASET